MKKTLIILLLSVVLCLGTLGVAEARIIRVKGYYKPSIGRYVSPSYRTSPNKSKLDNWSTKGNINIFTAKRGYKSSWSW